MKMMILKAVLGSYVGRVIGYRDSDKTHCIDYDGEDEVCYFDLTIDFLNEDIVLL